jgi:uroporphyrin-III C-methyltransferase/precorrin-2 dehydrogenase/sirohydrochlorin ferrochelatase
MATSEGFAVEPADEPALYPIFLKLRGRRVLVVGAGPVAERKIAALVGTGADVVVVAPEATAGVRERADKGLIAWHARAFRPSDADGAWLVVASTSDPAVQHAAAAAAEERRLFVLAVDDVANATAYSGAIVRRPPFTVAISSSGETPALTRLLREILEDALPPADWVEQAKALRAAWIASGTPAGARFADLVRNFTARARNAK